MEQCAETCCYLAVNAVIVRFIFRLYLCLDDSRVGATLHYTHCVSFSSVTDLYMQRSRTVLVVHSASALGLRYGTPRRFCIM